MGTRIVLASQKGGVGKTTVSLNLGVVLAERGKRVVLLDLDPQGGIALSLARDDTEWAGVAEYLMKKASMDQIIVETKLPGLSIVLRGGLDPRDVCEYEKVIHTPGLIEELVDDLARKADYVLVDTPSGLGMITRAALGAADYVLVPFQAEAISLRSISQILAVIEHVKENENSKLELLGILPTMVDLAKESSLAVMGTMWAGFGGILDTVIPRADVFAVASQSGLPVAFLGGRRASEARRFDMLATEIDMRIGQRDGGKDEQPQRDLL